MVPRHPCVVDADGCLDHRLLLDRARRVGAALLTALGAAPASPGEAVG